MYKKTFLCIAVFLITTIIFSSFQIQEDHKVLFEKAKYTMETKADLKEAINLFESLIKNYPNEKEYVAKSLLYQGMCYERLGNQEAVKKYQRLVKNYPGQKNEVALAKERLSKLMVVEKEAITRLIPKFTKIRTPFRIPQWSGSRLSPDGKILAFGSGGDVWTVPIPGKVDSGLAGEPKKLEGTSDVVGIGLSWSGDGRWIAFSRAFSPDLRAGGTGLNRNAEGAHIDVIPLFGGEPKRILVPQWLEKKGCTYPPRISLSPDGKLVAFDSGGQIYVASVETGDISQVTKDGGMAPCFSPDGTKITYIAPAVWPPDPRPHEVWVISADGDNPVKISGDLNEELSFAGPTWSPDGRMIAYCGDKLYIATLSDQGSPDASPIQIELPSMGFITGWTPDNKIGLTLRTPFSSNIYTVSVSGGKATQVSPLDKYADIPNWSADGKQIYFRWDGGLVSVPDNGGKVQPFSDLYSGMTPGGGHSVSPDGKSVLSAGRLNDERYIFTAPVEGGESKTITKGGSYRGYPCWSQDGKWIAYLAYESIGDEKEILTIFKIQREGGEAQKITTASDNVTYGGFDWSPDGKTIAYFSKKEKARAGTLNLVSIDGSESREVCQIKNITSHNNISWSPDGQNIAFTSRGKIWLVPAKGGKPVEVRIEVDASASMLDWSPDGKKIAFSGNGGNELELWMMENFLPLDKLAQKKTVAEDAPKVMTIKKVWAGSDVDTYGTPSPDGRYLTFTDWETGDLAIRELATGKTRRLTNKGTQKQQPAIFALNSVISPDSKLVAYSWTNEFGTYDLCLIGIDGSGNKILYNSKDIDEVYPVSWSSDGKQIAARRYSVKVEKAEIISIAVADGTVRVLKTLEKIFWPRFCYSPDDRFIAYDFPVAENSGSHDISLISTDGSGEISLIEHPANDRLLGWTPDRKEILFLSDRSGTWDAWIIQVDNGKPLGAPIRIKPDLGQVSPMAFTKNGSFYFSINTRRFTTQIAPFGLETGKVQEQLSKPLLGSNCFAEWSPDGEYLAYCSEQTEPAGPGHYHIPLHVLNLGTGEERGLAGDFDVMVPRWSPDGRSILFTGYDKNRRNQKDYNGGVYKIDVQDGDVTELVQFPPVQEPFHINFSRDSWGQRSIADWSHDGKDVFYVNRGRIFMRELESGREKQLYQSNNLRRLLDLSPDGKKLAFGTENSEDGTWSILIMPVSGEEPRELCKFQESEGIKCVTWTPDGKYVLFTENENKTKGSALWRISPEGGEPQKLWQSDKRNSGLSIHPDGQQIAFSTSEQEHEIWVMENFLPKEETASKQD